MATIIQFPHKLPEGVRFNEVECRVCSGRSFRLVSPDRGPLESVMVAVCNDCYSVDSGTAYAQLCAEGIEELYKGHDDAP